MTTRPPQGEPLPGLDLGPEQLAFGPRETCAACRFDSAALTDLDVGGSLRAFGTWWRLSLAGLDAVVGTRPAPGTWSALEYARHCGDVLELLGLGAAIVADADGVQLPEVAAPEPDLEPAPADPDAIAAAITRIDEHARALDALIAGGALRSPHRARLADGTAVGVGWLARHAVHDVLHHLHDVNRDLVGLGAGTPHQIGTVERINVSDGGVPKRAIERTTIGYRGLAEDRQAERRHHGRVFQAVCLWSADVIEELAAAGHPIAPGSAGENLTLRGIDWRSLRPGTHVRAGSALLELSVPAVPCAKNAPWFADRDFSRLHHDRHPEWTRWYASVAVDGAVATGDPVVIE